MKTAEQYAESLRRKERLEREWRMLKTITDRVNERTGRKLQVYVHGRTKVRYTVELRDARSPGSLFGSPRTFNTMVTLLRAMETGSLL